MLIVPDSATMHDSEVLNQSLFYKLPEETFFDDPSGYILGDSAYRLTNRVIKPFTAPQLRRDDAHGTRKSFNKKLSSARVKVEHTFGLMKCRFPALANLHLIVGLGPKSKLKEERVANENKRVSLPLPFGAGMLIILKACDAIIAMCVLHNFLLAGKDSWEPTEADKEVVAVLERKFYENLIHSPYAQMVVDDQAGNGAGRGDDDTNAGSAKRARLMAWQG
jgi:DDE superfamily endonuclease